MARSLKSNVVWVVALALIFGSMVFVLTSPELASLASGSSPAKFKAGDHVRAKYAQWYKHEWIVHEDLGETAKGRHYQLVAADEDNGFLEQYHSFEKDLIPADAPIPPMPEETTSSDTAEVD